jgi:hypothetical protein
MRVQLFAMATAVYKAPMQKQPKPIIDRLYIKQMFSMGCTG